MRLQAILFDVDGTIAETEEAHRMAFNHAFADAGRDWHWTVDDYRELLKVTGGRERIRHFCAKIGAPVSDDFIADTHRRKNVIYADLVRTGAARLRPGIVRLMAGARNTGVRLAIATTTSRSNLAALLDRYFEDWADWIEVIVAGEDVRRKKPDPEVYAIALERLALPASACLAIEDSRNGLLSAMAADIPALVTPSLYTLHENFDGAAAIQESLDAPLTDIVALNAILLGSVQDRAVSA